MALGNDAFDKNTALAEEAGRAYDTTGSKIRIALNTISNAVQNLADHALPSLAAAAEGASSGISDFATVSEGLSATLVTTSDGLGKTAAEYRELAMRLREIKTPLSDELARAVERNAVAREAEFALRAEAEAARAAIDPHFALGVAMLKVVAAGRELGKQTPADMELVEVSALELAQAAIAARSGFFELTDATLDTAEELFALEPITRSAATALRDQAAAEREATREAERLSIAMQQAAIDAANLQRNMFRSFGIQMAGGGAAQGLTADKLSALRGGEEAGFFAAPAARSSAGGGGGGGGGGGRRARALNEISDSMKEQIALGTKFGTEWTQAFGRVTIAQERLEQARFRDAAAAEAVNAARRDLLLLEAGIALAVGDDPNVQRARAATGELRLLNISEQQTRINVANARIRAAGDDEALDAANKVLEDFLLQNRAKRDLLTAEVNLGTLQASRIQAEHEAILAAAEAEVAKAELVLEAETILGEAREKSAQAVLDTRQTEFDKINEMIAIAKIGDEATLSNLQERIRRTDKVLKLEREISKEKKTPRTRATVAALQRDGENNARNPVETSEFVALFGG
jgi:hypothetical protein